MKTMHHTINNPFEGLQEPFKEVLLCWKIQKAWSSFYKLPNFYPLIICSNLMLII